MTANLTNIPTLDATPRTDVGKGAARRLRKEGRVPAITYGKGLPSTPIAVAPKDVLAVVKSELGKNSVVQMNVPGGSGKKLLAMIRDYSYHPVRRDLEHVDFVEVHL